MTHNYFNSSAIFAALAVTATPGWADLSAADVWANQSAFYVATGATVEGDLLANGTVAVPALEYTLPFGMGVIRADMPAIKFSENSDGTVGISYPDAFDVTLSATVPGKGPISVVLGISQTGHSAIASGTPGDVTYVQNADDFAITIKSYEAPDTESVELEGNLTGQGYDITTRIKEGDLITSDTEMALKPAEIAYEFSVNDGNEHVVVTSSAYYAASETTTQIALPKGGSNILNLTPAFDAGMSVSMRSKAEGNTTTTTTMIGDALMSDQTTSAGPSLATMSLAAIGLNLDFVAADFAMAISQPDMMPFPIDLTAVSANGGYNLPIIASAEPQDAGFHLGIVGLEMSEMLWSMIDGNSILSRDPVDMNIDIAAKVISDVNLFDFMSLEQKFSGSTPPGSLEELTVKELAFAAIGASAQASGAFTFDNSDLTTFGGIPRPEGDGLVTVSGADALLERLETLGFISAEDASGARLAKGIFGRASGDDSFETQLEINAEGHVIVNGQRIQ